MCKMKSVKKITIAAICLALCCVLPMAFHAFGLGHAFSPMHIPVLLCGLVCGCWYGLVCGIAGPILSSVLTGMPMAAGLVSMVPELAVYGFISGLLIKYIRTKHLLVDVYISLVIAMIAGRILGGIASALFYTGGSYTIGLWVTGYFINALPGIICHLVIVPLLVMTLKKAKLLPVRSSRKVS